MKISIKHFPGQYPSFNVSLSTKEGMEPFIEIKGCKIMSGSNGEFVSWPSRKLDSGKYWNHVYASNAFNEAVLKAAKVEAPAPVQAAPKAAPAGFDDMSDVPF
jgi:DNA-binding cell septation regulator SpoVG